MRRQVFACGLVASVMLTSPVAAKKIVLTGPTILMTDAFRAGSQSAEAALKANDVATASARINALIPTSDFEQYAVAGFRFQLATLRRDVQAQRIALSDMFKTSAVPRSDAPRLRFMAGYYSYLVGNYDDALAQLTYAKTLGYNNVDLICLTADIYFRKGRPKDARPYVQEALARNRAAGQKIPASWYDRAISMAYQAGDWQQLGALYQERLVNYPSRNEWRTALVNYLTVPGMDTQVQLDLYRLQAANGALASERDYQAYAILAEKAGNFAEAKTIIEAGRSAGKLTPTHVTSVQLLKAVTPKATKDIAALPALTKKAAAAKSGDAAMAAGDAYSSLGQYPQAVEQYRQALSKGGVNSGRANARLGVALARSGDYANARIALAQADGEWSSVAGFWTTWVDEQNRKTAAIPTWFSVRG